MVRNYQLLYTTMVGGHIPSLKLTATTPENGRLEDQFPFGKTYFQGELLVSGRYLAAMLYEATRPPGNDIASVSCVGKHDFKNLDR